jgi:hypothetical protein
MELLAQILSYIQITALMFQIIFAVRGFLEDNNKLSYISYFFGAVYVIIWIIAILIF